MTKRVSYLDHNASHPLRPGVAEAVADAMSLCGNASSVHAFGRRQHAMLEAARDAVRHVVGGYRCLVVFTSGATEANNLAIGNRTFNRVLVSAIEHPSVLKVRNDADVVPVSKDGVIDIGALERMLDGSEGSTLVSIMAANNETGVIQPMADIAEVVHRHGARLHCDAVQAVGRFDVNMRDLGIDLLSLSGHKFGAPQGIGALVVAEDLDLSPVQKGGGQERGLRAGTENVPAIAGLYAAINALDWAAERPEIKRLRDRLEAGVVNISPEVTIFSSEADRLANTSCFAVKGLSAETQVMALDLDGIAISAGSACSSGKVAASPVITAMGFDDDWAESAIRVSFGPYNTDEDVDKFLASWMPLVERHTQAQVSVAGTAA